MNRINGNQSKGEWDQNFMHALRQTQNDPEVQQQRWLLSIFERGPVNHHGVDAGSVVCFSFECAPNKRYEICVASDVLLKGLQVFLTCNIYKDEYCILSSKGLYFMATTRVPIRPK